MKGFFVIQEPLSGKFLKSKDCSVDSLVDFGTSVALYRTDTAANRAARYALHWYQTYREKWYGKDTGGSKEYIDRNYGPDLKRLVVYPLDFAVKMSEGEDVL